MYAQIQNDKIIGLFIRPQPQLEGITEIDDADPRIAAFNAPTAQRQIADFEATITSRRTRDAILGTDHGWLANVEAQIAALRSQLP